jgi:hypothetical protein
LKGQHITNYLFLEPKLYYYETSDGTQVFKARGVPKGLITYEIMQQLWNGNSIEFSCERLYKSLTKVSVSSKIINETSTRQYDRKIPVLNERGQLVAYKPLHISLFNQKLKT